MAELLKNNNMEDPKFNKPQKENDKPEESKEIIANKPEKETPVKPEPKKESSDSFIKKHPTLTAIFFGLVIALIIYFWKDIQLNNQRKTIEKRANEQLMAYNEEMLKLVSKPLVWSIRSELLRDNLEQVNILTSDLVKEKNFQFIHLINPEGNVLVSTDKKMEGQSALHAVPSELLQADTITVLKKDDGLLTLGAPVMGYDKRLATLIMSYKPVKYVSDRADEKADSTQAK